MPSNFDPIYSTDNIWREDNMQRSLSDDLNTIESNISTLETNKANSNHTHIEYATNTHTHSYNDLTDKPTIPSTTDFATASYVDGELNGKVDKVTGKGLSSNDYTTAEKLKLAGIAAGANKTIIDSSLSSTSTNPVQNKVINSALAGKASSSHDHSTVTTSTAGFMSADDKTKLDGIATGANNYTLPNATSSNLGGVKIGNNITVSSGTISLSKANVTSALGYTPFNSANVIPKSKGGTGADFSNIPANAIIRNSGSGGSDLYYFATADGACYATSTNGYPTFGTLPVAQGGTGETTAWTNGTVSSLNSTTITSYQFAVFPYLNKAFIRLNVLLGSALDADEARYIAMPSTVSTAHTALSCFNIAGYDIHCGMASNNGIYVINCGTGSMSTSVRLYIAGWYSI